MLDASLIRTLEDIYGRLHTFGVQLTTGNALVGLTNLAKREPSNPIFDELIAQISALRAPEVPIEFIERFCLNKLSIDILDKYPVNIAEAYIISYIVLNKVSSLDIIYFKLGSSGLLTTTKIKGNIVSDIEKIAQFVIESLHTAELIYVTPDHRCVMAGKQLLKPQ